MSQTIKLKRGTSTPTTSNIVSGEVAIDTSAQKLYINDAGTIKEIGGGLASISVDDVPNLPASKITSGTFSTARIPNLSASKITSGTLDVARLPTIPYSQLSGTPTIPTSLPANGGNSDTVDGYHASDIMSATSARQWSGLNASGAQAKRYTIMRLYVCPGHWDSGHQNIKIFLHEESYESSYVEYHLWSDYNGGNQNTAMQLFVKDAGGYDNTRYKVTVGSPVDAGYDYSGQNVYYYDIHVDVAFYKQVRAYAFMRGHGYTTTAPTSGSATTLVYTSPSGSNISDFTDVKTNSYFKHHKIWNEANDGPGSGLDADLLDGQQGSHYLNYNNLTNKPSIPSVGNGTMTITAGTSLTGGGAFTANQSGNSSVTLNVATPSDAPGSWQDVVGWNGGLIKDTAVEIHGSGYLRATYLNMTHGVGTRSSDTIFYSSNDDYIRKTNATGMRTALSVYSKTESDGRYQTPANDILKYRGTWTTQDWNDLVDSTEAGYRSVVNTSGNNRPSEGGTDAYPYGVAINASVAGQGKFTLYSPHNATSGHGLWFRSGWNTDYDEWRRIAMYNVNSPGTNHLYAHTFYDEDDTTYYANPAAMSELKDLRTGRDHHTNAPRWDTSFYVAQSQHWYGHSSSQTMYIGESANPVRLRGSLRVGSDANANSGMKLTVSGSADATSSFRAPIFYDSNNTNWFLDPNSTGTSGKFAGNVEIHGDLKMNGTDSLIWTPNADNRYTGFYDSRNSVVAMRVNTNTAGNESVTFGGNGGTTASVWINTDNQNNYNNYNENIRLYNAGNSASVIAFGAAAGTNGGLPSTSLLGYSDRFETRVGSTWRQRIYGGYIDINGSVRPDLMYDRNNTGYYVYPASRSRLLSLTTRNRISIGSDGNLPYEDTGEAGIWFSGTTGNATWFAGLNGASTSAQFRLYSGGNRFLFSQAGVGEATSSWRAPIFYDSDNTTYYLNPNGTSNLSALNVGGSPVWTSGNDGSNSGLDADLLDGQHGSYYTGAKGTNQNYVASSTSTSNRGNYGAGVWAYSGYSTGSNRPHTYDATLQVMPDANRGFEISADWLSQTGTPLKVRSLRDCCQGWSEWSTIWTSATDGANSGLDADLLDGQHGSHYLNYNNLTNKPTIPNTSNMVTTNTAQTISGAKTFTANVGVSGNVSANFYSFNGSYVNATADVRAPIFYDRNNTGYYVHADSESHLNSVRTYDLRVNDGNGRGLRFWNNNLYKIYMSATSDTSWGGRAPYESTSDYNMYFRMTSGTNRGFVFRNDTTNVAGIDGSGNFNTNGIIKTGNGAASAPAYSFTADYDSGMFSLGSNAVGFSTGGTQRFKINANGLLLTGTSSLWVNGQQTITNTRDIANVVNYQNTDGHMQLHRTAAAPLIINRKGTTGSTGSSRGEILNFKSASTKIGRIGYAQPYGGNFYFAAGDWGLGLYSFSSSRFVQPSDHTGAIRDNQIDLGSTTARFDDVYATNGTIQTSDRNEKQDIQELTDAETRAAVTCKGLMRRFRWVDSVAEKGDEARYHFGAIAQDVEAAFTAEGLDAGDYGLFIRTTWWEHEGDWYPEADVAPEGAVEKTRLGIRYNQLFAFIIGAL